MKKTIIIIILLGVSVLYSRKIGHLTGIMQPDNMIINAGFIYVMEGAEVLVYSLSDMSLVRKFGKEGEGPGEVKRMRVAPNTLSFNSGNIIIDGSNKILYFSQKGKFIKEIRKKGRIVNLSPLGEKYVGIKLKPGKDKLRYDVVVLYDSNLKEIKEIFKQPQSQQRIDVKAIPDSLNFCVYKNKLFIDQSINGFKIGVYDLNGKELYKINNKYNKILVTKYHKKYFLDRLYKDKIVKNYGIENLHKRFNFTYQKYLPAIQNMNITDDKIFIKTFHIKDEKTEFIVMDLKGNIIKKCFLQNSLEPSFISSMLGKGIKYFDISNDKYYYLIENEDEEEYELHVEKI